MINSQSPGRICTQFAVAAACALGALSGCGGDSAPEDLVGLQAPAAGEGLQFKMVSTMAPAFETERCQMFRVPPEGIAFDRSEVRYTVGSHHVLLFETPYTEIPTEDEHGVAVDPMQVHECPEGAPERWDVTRVIGGSQNADGANLLEQLPAGVAMKVQPNTLVMMNTHYLNASPEELVADARINVYTVPVDSVEQEAGVLFYYNPFIHLAPQSTGKARMGCTVTKDITLLNLQSHMHARGVDYVANLVSADGKSEQELYTNTEWEGVPIQQFDGGLAISKGDVLDYECTYDNSEDRTVIQGLTTRDEMCMLIGPYYPRDDALELCEDDEGDYVAEWTGSGEVDCGQSFKCMLEAVELPGDEATEKYFGCVVNSCANASREVSDVIKCQLSSARGQCDDYDLGDDDWVTCILDKCGDEITACGGSTCD